MADAVREGFASEMLKSVAYIVGINDAYMMNRAHPLYRRPIICYHEAVYQIFGCNSRCWWSTCSNYHRSCQEGEKSLILAKHKIFLCGRQYYSFRVYQTIAYK